MSTHVSKPKNDVRRSDNQRTLKKIDVEITSVLKAIDRAETSDKERSSRVIAAGVQMLSIIREEPAAWDAFKDADETARGITCKGKDWDTREIAKVLWRRVLSPNRERVSSYGKAIRVAHDAYWEPGLAKTSDQLIQRISPLGIRGLLKIARTPRGNGRPKKISLPIPDVLTLVLLVPDGSHQVIDPEKAKPWLIKLGLLKKPRSILP